MNYFTIVPPKILAEYVRFFWVLEGDATSQAPFVHTTLPDVCPELLFYFKGGFHREIKGGYANTFTAGIYGQSQHRYTFRTESSFGIFGVYLFPDAIPRLLSYSAPTLSGDAIDLKTLCGQEGQELTERVICAASHKERVMLLTEFLTRKLNIGQERYNKIISCIKQLINSSQLGSVSSLAEECNYSRKQFERKFKEYSGFSPKHFLILTRFRNALQTQRQTDTLSQLAVRCGYFDQAHFIHDFHKLSGYNPRDFFQQHSDVADYRLTRAS